MKSVTKHQNGNKGQSEKKLTGRDSDNSVGNLVSKVSLGGVLHLSENHGGNFLRGLHSEVRQETAERKNWTHEALVTTLGVHSDDGFPALLCDLEGPVLHILLNIGVVHLAANETLGIEDGVLGVGVEGVLGGVTDTARMSKKSYRAHRNTYSRSSSLKLTQEGVIRLPWSLAMISTTPPRWTPTQEYLREGLVYAKDSVPMHVRGAQINTNYGAILGMSLLGPGDGGNKGEECDER